MKIDVAVECLVALGNPTRLKIYRLLARSAGGMPVGWLQARLDAAASTLSHHLKALIEAGLIHQTRRGTTLICHIDRGRMRDLVRFLVKGR
jgi:ArsR family transcriptional regulator, arsenate/arsenite/antimonite-responsive transcriptional repressor